MVAWALPALYGAGALIAMLVIFQLFFRYQYIETDGVLLRVDRITQQTCRMTLGKADCTADAADTKPKFSTSTSTSTSLSTSVSLKPALPKKH